MAAVTTLAPFQSSDDMPLPTAPKGTGHIALGAPVARVDGRAKVTGAARYAAEHPAPDLVFGVAVNSSIVRGRITQIDVAAALAVPGVLDVLTHQHRPRMRSLGLMHKDSIAPGGSPFKPLYDEEVRYSGQPVALVLAETFEAARHAAGLVQVHIDAQPHETRLLPNMQKARRPSRLKLGYAPPPKPRGDVDKALANAAASVDLQFHSGVEHHNPMEMHASTVVRGDDGHLTIYDKTQGSQNCRWVVSHAFGIGRDKVTVRNPYVGGAFGSGLRPQYPLLLAVMGALQLKRSVRVVLTRQQMFTFGHRPETWQRVQLAADADGALTAIVHDAVAETSRWEDYVENVVNWSAFLYSCPSVKLGYKVLELDQYTPLDMRAPGGAHGVHALEVAMDELAHRLRVCPLDLRLRNYSERDAAADLPYSSKALRACYELGAARFGWAGRPLAPRATREGHELVGWGMATGVWDALQMFARAEATLGAHGRLEVACAASDIGTGTYTVMSQIAAAAMGLPLEQVRFRLGDSTLPVAPVEGGSSHVATVGSAVQGVCDKLKHTLFDLARGLAQSPLQGMAYGDVVFADGAIRVAANPAVAMFFSDILAQAGKPQLQARYLMLPRLLQQRKYARYTHGAVFCEVKVDELMGTVRVTRLVSAIAAGRILNPTTARSQILGGQVWGISAALLEHTLVDHTLGRFMNHSFAEYHVPTNADIAELDAIFVEEDDRIVSALGAKGVGEIGMIGVAAAICNAVHHATGRRVLHTPMTPAQVMSP